MRKLYALLLSLTLLCVTSVPVSAAPRTPLFSTRSNSFTVTHTADYQFTLQGGQGATVGDMGGMSNRIIANIHLVHGDKVRVELGNVGIVEMIGNVQHIHGGTKSNVYVDFANDNAGEVLVLSSGGGQGTVGTHVNNENADKVTIYAGDDTSNISSDVHWHKNALGDKSNTTSWETEGGCFNWPYWYYSYQVSGGHTLGPEHYHADTVNPDGIADACNTCSSCGGHSSDGQTGGSCPGNTYTVNGHVNSYTEPRGGVSIQRYDIDCYMDWGQVLTPITKAKTQDYINTSYCTQVKTTPSTGKSYFSFNMLPIKGVRLDNVTANKIYFKLAQVHCIVKEDTITYYDGAHSSYVL